MLRCSVVHRIFEATLHLSTDIEGYRIYYLAQHFIKVQLKINFVTFCRCHGMDSVPWKKFINLRRRPTAGSSSSSRLWKLIFTEGVESNENVPIVTSL